MQNLISELERMCWHKDFNRYEALHIARQLDLNQVFLSSTKRYSFQYKTTFLEEAIECYNIPMVELLLQNGADPNFIDPKGEADHIFWTLQFADGTTKEEDNIRLEIAELMLHYGADPNCQDDNEELLTEIINSYLELEGLPISIDCLKEYGMRFMILLIAYGGKSSSYPVEIVKDFDKSNLKQYKLKKIFPFGRKVTLGVIVDGEGNTVAYV